MLSAPRAGALALGPTQWGDPQAPEQPIGSFRLSRTQPSEDLLDVDCRRERNLTVVLHRLEAGSHVRSSPEGVDQYGRVEQDGHSSADAPPIRAALRGHPLPGIVVPFMTPVRYRAERRPDQLPALANVERLAHRELDEPAAAARAHLLVEPGEELVVEVDVDTHTFTIAHLCTHNKAHSGQVRPLEARLEPGPVWGF